MYSESGLSCVPAVAARRTGPVLDLVVWCKGCVDASSCLQGKIALYSRNLVEIREVELKLNCGQPIVPVKWKDNRGTAT